MERGPLALFGAIVAIGIGPALWLGAQIGTLELAPPVAPANVGEQAPGTGTQLDIGGVGAGDGTGRADETGPTSRHTVPSITSAATTAPASRPVADPVLTVSPAASVSPSATPSSSAPETPPPTESASTPVEDPGPSGSPTAEPEDPDQAQE